MLGAWGLSLRLRISLAGQVRIREVAHHKVLYLTSVVKWAIRSIIPHAICLWYVSTTAGAMPAGRLVRFYPNSKLPSRYQMFIANSGGKVNPEHGFVIHILDVLRNMDEKDLQLAVSRSRVRFIVSKAVYHIETYTWKCPIFLPS